MKPSHAARKSSTLRFHKQQLLRVLVHIQRNLDLPADLESLASLACLSPFHFHRVFRGMLGESLAAYVRRLRLERAAMALREGRRAVVDIAFEAGYDSHEAFCRAFRAAYYLSPSAYRKRPSAAIFLNAPSGLHFRPDAPPVDFKTQNQGARIMQIKIETIAPFRVAYVRHVGPYNQCHQAWDKLCQWLAAEGLLAPGKRFLGLSYDDPVDTPPEKLRYDACVELGEDIAPGPGIGVQLIEGGLYARTTHQGAYENLSKTYGEILGQWLPRQPYRLRNAPSFEVYLNTPENTEPEDLLTDIHVPIEEMGKA